VRAKYLVFLPEDQHAETEQQWYERERWQGKQQQGRTQFERWLEQHFERSRKKRWQQQLAERLRFVTFEQPQRFQPVGINERQTRHWSRHDLAGFDPGGAGFSHG